MPCKSKLTLLHQNMHYTAIDQRNDKSAKSWQFMQKLQTPFINLILAVHHMGY